MHWYGWFAVAYWSLYLLVFLPWLLTRRKKPRVRWLMRKMGYVPIPKVKEEVIETVTEAMFNARFGGPNWGYKNAVKDKDNTLKDILQDTRKQAHAAVEVMLLIPRDEE